MENFPAGSTRDATKTEIVNKNSEKIEVQFAVKRSSSKNFSSGL